MTDLGTSPATHQPPQPSAGWKTIGGQRECYDEGDCLNPSHSLVSEKLRERGEDDVVIFDYSLNPDYLSARDEDFGDADYEDSDYDVFFRVPKDGLMGSDQLEQIVDQAREPRPMPSQGPRLGIIDFPQCYDTSDGNLLNLMAGKLRLITERGATFRDEHSKRVEALPGHGRFRTGVSLRVPSKRLLESSGSDLSETRFTLFVSYPYFGEPNGEIPLGARSESVRLLDFKGLGVYERHGGGRITGGSRIEIEEVLVHQARYMIFDNYTMAAFRSKEDPARNQVPLHRFQERIGAFRAMVHMIANRTGLELSTFVKLQASLYKLEDDIDQMISDEGKEGVDAQERRQRGRGLLTSINRLSTSLFAAISVAERQITVLQDLHSMFLTSYRTKTSGRRVGSRNPFHRNTVLIPVLSENREQIWPSTLDTIDEVVRERKAFIGKIKELVENTDIKRKILSGFLKSDQAEAAPSERTAQEAKKAMEATKEAIERTQAQVVQQVQTLSGFAIVTTAFLPLSFCAEYYSMGNIKEWEDKDHSLLDFWLATGPVLAGVLLLTLLVVCWKRQFMERPKGYLEKGFGYAWEKLSLSGRRRESDPENQGASSGTNAKD
ncbi:unnamed protein product [Tuber aestivum]|uniref:Uncharacterized protein n=1 Tax=Tuber aestivum TaxID=59557 RepID=A0A292Q2G1_9PEZI|nr:unnamed protein product [Tuber aestivum]